MECNELETLRQQLEDLGERFRRIAASDSNEADVIAGTARGGRLILSLSRAGLLPGVELPEPAPPTRASDDDSHDMAAIWHAVVMLRSGNLSRIQWEHRGGPADIYVGQTNPRHWRIRAENYAEFCDEVADYIGDSGGAATEVEHRQVEVPVVEISATVASITWKQTKHPVEHAVADAFAAMLKKKGQPTGIQKILGCKVADAKIPD